MHNKIKMQKMIGSIWSRWDLHIHTPGTKLADAFTVTSGDVWETYLQTLEESSVSVFGITDYFNCAAYFDTVERYKNKYPDGEKIFFPNVELRLTETVNKAAEHIHAHIVFDNNESVCPKVKIEEFLARLETHLVDRTGAKVKCNSLTSQQVDSATVAFQDVCNALKSVFGAEKPFLILAAANGDGLRADTNSPRKRTLSDSLEQGIDAFFGSHKNTEWFLQTDRYDDKEIKSRQKPVFTGSDAHSFAELDRLSGDVPGWDGTWIKAEHTFRGLMQTAFEPSSRVFIGDEPEVRQRLRQEGTRFIKEITINQVSGYDPSSNGSWFDAVSIPFNPELTAIIGNKGSGKSAIADILGLCGESRQESYFSFLSNNNKNKKFREKGYAENFEAKLFWNDGNTSTKRLDQPIDPVKPERVKYLPQNFFEHLTNDIEVQAFRSQIEEVVFSHVETTSRMGTSSFQELEDFKTSEGRKTISVLKTKLREVNFSIAELEDSLKPEKRSSLVQELDAKEKEVTALIASKPDPVLRPGGDDQEQLGLTAEIEKLTLERVRLVGLDGEFVSSISALKAKRERLTNLYKRVQSLASHVAGEIEGISAECKGLGIEYTGLIEFQADISRITVEGQRVKAEILALETPLLPETITFVLLSDVKTLPDARRAQNYLDDLIAGLRERLSAPHKRYQLYVETTNMVDERVRQIRGDPGEPQAGTIAFIKRDIDRFDSELTKAVVSKELERKEIVRSIFESKKEILEFYEELKASVEAHLEKIRGFDDTFRITIEASFIQKPEMADNFFDFVDQRKSGVFSAVEKGASKISDLSLAARWADFDGVWAFTSGIVHQMKSASDSLDRQLKQNKSVKEFYDFLFSIDYLDVKYELKLGGKSINQLSPGEKGLLLLVFYLHLDRERIPLIIDQPEDNLDNDSIFKVLATCIREAKKNRQVILVTHNPNLAVGADAEQIIYVKLEKHRNSKFSYESGAIENDGINDAIVTILEGSHPAFIKRRLKYGIV